MAKRYLALMMILCLVVCPWLSVIAETEESDVQEDMLNMEVTKEYMMEKCGLTDQDFEGIDFPDFIQTFRITKEKLEEYDGSFLLAMYREALKKKEATDYTAIYSQAAGKLTDELIPRITVVVWEIHSGNRNTCMAVDFTRNGVYGGERYCLPECFEKDRLADLSEEDKAFVRQQVIDQEITGWENEYMGTNEGTTGLFAWKIGISVDTGESFVYEGSGVLNSGTPAGMNRFCTALWNRFSGTESVDAE